MYRIHKRKNRFKKTKNVHLGIIIIPVTFIIISICILVQFEHKILPSAMSISHLQAKTIANRIIDDSVKKTLSEMDIHSSDFFVDINTGSIPSFSANTILINETCTNVSNHIANGLSKIYDEKIDIPFGTLTGFEILSNTGPDISFTMKPMGEAQVDYETSFSSVGINQTNFKIWINVSIAIQIVNPLQQEKINLTRKLMLVDTVINGEVPSNYLEFK